MKHFTLVALLLVLFSAPSLGGRPACCDRCGRQCECREVCRLVCEMKEDKEICYFCKDESFCVPGRSTKCGTECHCDPCKQGTGYPCVDCLLGQYHGESCRTVWKPSCEADLHCRTKLYKREIVRKVPTYKWIVFKCCDQCEKSSTDDAAAGRLPSTSGAVTDVGWPVPIPAEFQLADRPKLPWSSFFK